VTAGTPTPNPAPCGGGEYGNEGVCAGATRPRKPPFTASPPSRPAGRGRGDGRHIQGHLHPEFCQALLTPGCYPWPRQVPLPGTGLREPWDTRNDGPVARPIAWA